MHLLDTLLALASGAGMGRVTAVSASPWWAGRTACPARRLRLGLPRSQRLRGGGRPGGALRRAALGWRNGLRWGLYGERAALAVELDATPHRGPPGPPRSGRPGGRRRPRGGGGRGRGSSSRRAGRGVAPPHPARDLVADDARFPQYHLDRLVGAIRGEEPPAGRATRQATRRSRTSAPPLETHLLADALSASAAGGGWAPVATLCAVRPVRPLLPRPASYAIAGMRWGALKDTRAGWARAPLLGPGRHPGGDGADVLGPRGLPDSDLPERMMEWLLLFVPPEQFEQGLQRFGPRGQGVLALIAGVVVMGAILLGLGTLALRRGWPGRPSWASPSPCTWWRRASCCPSPGAGLFGADLLLHPVPVNATYLGPAPGLRDGAAGRAGPGAGPAPPRPGSRRAGPRRGGRRALVLGAGRDGRGLRPGPLPGYSGHHLRQRPAPGPASGRYAQPRSAPTPTATPQPTP